MTETVPAALREAWDKLPNVGGEATPAFYDAEQQILFIDCLNVDWQAHLLALVPELLGHLHATRTEPRVQDIRVGLRPIRLLVTGSRTWEDEPALWDALLEAWHDTTQVHGPEHRFIVVHGGCGKGADWMAHRWAMRHRFQGDRVDFEPHPADWQTHGNYAGPLRNQAMVDLGADLVLAFHRDGSRGTSDCVRRAQEAGLPVRTYLS